VAGGVLTAEGAARHVRPALDGLSPGWRPLGTFVYWRPALDSIRAVLECAGPPGVTAIAAHAPQRAGLRTARSQTAPPRELAGYAVVDSGFGLLPDLLSPARHLCVFDWLTPSPALPSILTVAAATGARRHVWIRFCRDRVPGAGTLELEPLMTRDLTNTVFV